MLIAQVSFGTETQPVAAAPLPPLASDPPATVVPVSAAVSLDADTLTMDVAVKSEVSESPALILTGVPFGWAEPSTAYADRQFPELVVRIDDAPTALEERFEAFAGTNNITYYLKSAQIDPWTITLTPPFTAPHPPHPQVLKALENLGAIEKSGEGYLAKWTARRIIRIPLKAAPIQHVALAYTARPAMSVEIADQLDSTRREKTFCISPASLAALTRKRLAATRLTVSEFAIAMGIDGKPPLSASLNVSARNGAGAWPTTYWFFCGPHGKPSARTGSVTRAPIELDDSGTSYVLRVITAPSAGP